MTNTNKKRVALCIFGQPRSLVRAFPYIKKNIININPGVDIFLHCWYDPSETGKTYAHVSDTTREEGKNIIDHNVPLQLKELYTPVALLVEKQENFSSRIKQEYIDAKDKTNPFATFSMWTSIYRCNELKHLHEQTQNFTYDAVIRCRYDIKLNSPLHISCDNSLHASDKTDNESIVEDILFYANSPIMDTLCSLVTEIDSHFKSIKKWNNELLLAEHCRVHNIQITQHNDWNYTLIRGERSFFDTIWYLIRRLRNKLHI